MKWILIITALLYWPIITANEIQIKQENMPAGMVDSIENRVCAPHFRLLEANLDIRRRIGLALVKHSGNSREDLMYKIELMNADQVAKVNIAKVRDALVKCSSNLE